jgi:hypothetical protein
MALRGRVLSPAGLRLAARTGVIQIPDKAGCPGDLGS